MPRTDGAFRMIAALFVETAGVYFGLPDVDPWDVRRDARKYAGPFPVVAHPPCDRWGRYWHGGPSAKTRKVKGDDGGCFHAALEAVRRFGGVLEHPEASAAWATFGLIPPPIDGAWVTAGDFFGWTCCVEQGHYGHRARKKTWLYAARIRTLPGLLWGPSIETAAIDGGFHTAEERRRFRKLRKNAGAEERGLRNAWLAERAKRLGKEWCCPERMNKRERTATPIPFRDLLLSIARAVPA